MSEYLELTQHNFKEEVYEANVAVFVDFYTEGCGPCELIPKLMEQLKERYGDKVKFCTFNVDIDEVVEESNEVIQKYKVFSYPTLMIFKDGEAKANLVGEYDLEPLVKELEKVL